MDAGTARVTRIRQVDGYSARCAQPSIVVQVSVSAFEAPPDLRERLARLLNVEFPGRPRAAVPVAGLLAEGASRVLAKAGIPQFSNPLFRPLEAPLWEIQVPTIPGVHVLTGALLKSMADALPALCAGSDLAEQARRIGKIINEIRREAPAGKNPFMMLETAQKAGIPWRRVAGNNYALGQGSRTRWFNSSITDRTSSIGVMLARQKDLTAQVLRSRGIPVPEHQLVRNETEALAAAERIGYPVVVKPSNQDRGLGVHAMLRTPQKVAEAFHDAHRHGQSTLVEKHVEGEDYRVFVHEGEVFRVRHRVPGSVTGDGRSTVRELLDVLNADPRRGEPGSFSEWTRIPLDAEALELLAEQGLDPDAVPAEGRFVRLRRIANVSVGGIPHVVEIADVHPDNIDLAVRAVGALKLDLAAIDLLMPDIRKSWTEVGAAICEVNAQPQWAAGAPEWLFAKLFPGQGRIPVVAVIADAAPPWIKGLVQRAEERGVRVGLASGAGAWRSGKRMAAAVPPGVFHAWNLLVEDTEVDAIVAVAGAGLERLGLPVDRVDVTVLATAQDFNGQTLLVDALTGLSTQVLCDGSLSGWQPARGAIRCADVRELPAEQLQERLLDVLAPISKP